MTASSSSSSRRFSLPRATTEDSSASFSSMPNIASLTKQAPALPIRINLRTIAIAASFAFIFSVASIHSLFHSTNIQWPTAFNLQPPQPPQNRSLTAALLTNATTKSEPTEPTEPTVQPLPKKDLDILYRYKQKESDIRHRLLSDMPECASRGRANSFLMVFMGHSGSTALMTSLKQHSQTHIDGLEPVDHGEYREGSRLDSSLKALIYTKSYFLEGANQSLTSGFKIRPHHLTARPMSFSHLVERFRTRIIWSYRTNMMKQAIGDYAIHYHGDKSAYEGLKLTANGTLSAGEKGNGAIRIEHMDKLHELLLSRIRGDKQISDALRAISPDGCVLPVSYESYLRHPHLTLERVQKFLGMRTDEMHPALRAKANRDSICDLVENWAELCEAFFNCMPWRWMLDDYENGCSCSALSPSRFHASKKFCSI